MSSEKAVLFIGANRPIPGKESEAMSLWMETHGFLDKARAAGWFSRWDGFWLTPHGGDLNSAFICYGDRAKLDEWRRTDEFEAWVFKVGTCLEGLGIIPGVNAAAGAEAVARRNKALG
jgi:hypothetical protein